LAAFLYWEARLTVVLGVRWIGIGMELFSLQTCVPFLALPRKGEKSHWNQVETTTTDADLRLAKKEP
jgi:hypothetical protein